MDKQQFTIRLANGKERTFESAAAMVEWMNLQRGLEYSGSRQRAQRTSQNRSANRSAKPKQPASAGGKDKSRQRRRKSQPKSARPNSDAGRELFPQVTTGELPLARFANRKSE